jgi:histidyl-tRNA synthetase
MKICAELWDAGIKADFMYKSKPKLLKQFEFCDKEEHQIPWMIIIGSDELAKGQVRIKNMQRKEPEHKEGDLVYRSEMVTELKKRLASS